MRRSKLARTFKTAIALVALLLLTTSAAAQSGDIAAPNANYTLFWWTVDGSGDTSVAVKYTLGGTAGQPGNWEKAATRWAAAFGAEAWRWRAEIATSICRWY